MKLLRLRDDELNRRLTAAEALLLICDCPRRLSMIQVIFEELLAEARARDLIHRPNDAAEELLHFLT